MNVSVNQKYLQIMVEDDNAFLHKAIAYAEKYFSKSYRLSRTVLILDDGERFKKDYLINWAYHVCLQEDSKCADSKSEDSKSQESGEMPDLEYLLDFTYLPIRIKIVGKNSLVERVKIALRILNGKRVMLKMSKVNATARRYIANLFEEYYLGCDRDEVYLDSTKPYFWESIINLVSFKVVHNVILDFDYESFHNRGGLGGLGESFLTAHERELRQSYMILESSPNDDFDTIKKRYLRLAKEYHPDNVFGQDSQVVESYNERFRSIQEAYEKIRTALRIAS
ncbi:J domain-containing protein [Helicobacter sp. MIT 99-10781]|uniref:J domain-containing protein n=1 Tax=Helicobacter sp. MIT 99-10781 TaxID=1332285 RepID=UPI000E207EE5|nr:J domain-containing protein [Helicobacter sp. MIT 99-10781]RDU57024.1 J domain-containing protein [Helicobacter sp. MIT 99-10781]